MRAIVFQNQQIKFNPVYPDPKPISSEVLIKVKMAGICATDQEIVKGYMNFSGVPGHEFVGTVVKGPRELNGKRVVAEISCVCGKCDMCQSGLSNHCRERKTLGIDQHDGVFADYIALPARNIHLVPDSVTDEQAVFVEPLAAALQIVRQIPIEKRHKIAVLGDGRLGLLTVQVLAAKAGRVVLVGKHQEKLNFAEKRGIQGILREDLHIKPEWDVVVDCTGTPQGFTDACCLVRPRGRLVMKSTWVAHNCNIDLSPLVINEITLIGSRCGPFPEALSALASDQVVVNGLITGRYKLNQAEEAFAASTDPRQIKVVFELS